MLSQALSARDLKSGVQREVQAKRWKPRYQGYPLVYR